MDILIAALALLGAIVINMMASEFYDRAPLIARWIVKQAARLTKEDRKRYEEEWSSHLDECAGKLGQLLTACDFLRAGLIISKRASHRIPSKSVKHLSNSDPVQIPPEQQKEKLGCLSPQTMRDILETAYGNLSTINERDVWAFVVRHAIHLSPSQPITLDELVTRTHPRLLTPQEGGRSATLAAVTSRLWRDRIDPGLVPILTTVAELQVRRHTYIYRQFGPLIVASLADQFPDRSELTDLLQELIALELNKKNKQTALSLHVAGKLRLWLPKRKKVPLHRIFPSDWLNRQIVCSLPGNAEVFSRPEAAKAAFERLEHGIAGVSPRELSLADQWMKLEALKRFDECTR